MNELDYDSESTGGSDVDDIGRCTRESTVECAAICQAFTSSSIARLFPACSHDALHSGALNSVQLLFFAPLFLLHIANA